MPLVKVMQHRQVAIPKELFEELELAIGDYLEAKIQNGQLVYSPKQLIDREIAQALEEIKQGKFYGPFRSVKAWVKSLKQPK